METSVNEGMPIESGVVMKDGLLVFVCEFEDPDFDLVAFVEEMRNKRDRNADWVRNEKTP